MVNMGATHIFDAKIVNDQGKRNGAGAMGPKGRCSFDGAIPKLGKVLGELIVGNATGLFESGHTLSNFHVHPSVSSIFESVQVILGDDFVRKKN
jgi:hypothetical protein